MIMTIMLIVSQSIDTSHSWMLCRSMENKGNNMCSGKSTPSKAKHPDKKKPCSRIRVKLVQQRIMTIQHWFELVHDKTDNKTCATSKNSDQPAHLHNLIRVFVDLMCLRQPPGYPKRAKQEVLPHCVDAKSDLSLCWIHMSHCRICSVLAHL